MSNPVLSENAFRKAITDHNQKTMTLNGAIFKTFVLLAIFILTAMVVTSKMDMYLMEEIFTSKKYLLYGTLIATIIIAFIISFKPNTAPILAPVYAIIEAIPVTLLSLMMNSMYEGIVAQAVTCTVLVLFVMLVLYRTRIIKVTDKFKSVVISALLTISIFYLAMFIMSIFGIRLDLFYGNSLLSIGINAVIIVVAAFSLILDFNFIEQGVAQEAPQYMEWYGAFGLLVTLVWLYIEFLRILSKIKSR